MEEVKGVRYLGYIVQKNVGVKKHTKERKKKSIIVIRKVWNMGGRIFGEDYKRRIKMFSSLVESVGLFRADVWRWKKFRWNRKKICEMDTRTEQNNTKLHSWRANQDDGNEMESISAVIRVQKMENADYMSKMKKAYGMY